LLWGLAACGDVNTFHLVGTVERKALELAAPVSEVIVEVPVAIGDRVAAGQIVVQMDTRVADAERRAYEAGKAAADAALKEAQGEFERFRRLRQSGVATAQALDTARRKLDEARAAVAEKEARIAQADKRLEDLTLRSTTAGVVDQLPFEQGERVPAGGVVAVVVAEEKPWVRVWLPARAVGRLGPESEARVRVTGVDGTFQGRVESVAREPEFTPHYALTEKESAHLVYETHIVLDDAPDELREGLSARVTLDARPAKAGG
jgi:HlyD family secretion protein